MTKEDSYDLKSVVTTNSVIFRKIELGSFDGVKSLTKEPRNSFGINDEGQTPLHYAIEHNRHEIALYLLEIGHDPNTSDRSNWTPLISAARNGNLKVVTKLIENGAQQKYKDDEICEMGEWSAVTWAAYKGHANVLDLLLTDPEHRGDPNFSGVDQNTSYGVTPLLWAAGRGHVAAVEVLLKEGIGTDVNKTDKFGCNAMFWACRKGEVEVVERLIDAKIDMNTIGAHGQSALIVAAKNCHEDIVDKLLTCSTMKDVDPVNVSHVDSDTNTALNYAADKGLNDTARRLLGAGASKNHQNKKKQSPLILAVKHGNLEIVQLLLEHDCNVNLVDKENRTALYHAVKEATSGGKTYKEIVKVLLKRRDIDMEVVTKIHDAKRLLTETCLLKAVKNRNATIVNFLLKAGARVDVRDQDWNNPLHLSIKQRDKTITEMLLRNPKNSNLVYKKNKDNQTPHEIDLENRQSILTKIWGEKVMTSSTKGVADDMSQYELYTNSLADILAEPELKLPITVGIFAQWGSGKDFLLHILAKVMGSFVGDEGEVTFNPHWGIHLRFFLLLGWIVAIICGLVSNYSSPNYLLVIPSVVVPIVVIYSILMVFSIWGNGQYLAKDRAKKWAFCNSLARTLSRFDTKLKLISSMLFRTGIVRTNSDETKAVKFLFADQARLSLGATETSLAEVVGALSKTAEDAFGFLPVRIYRAMKPRHERNESRTFCCMPVVMIANIFVLDLMALSILLSFSGKLGIETVKLGLIITGVIGGILFGVIFGHFWKILKHLFESPYSRVMKEATKIQEGGKTSRDQLKREVDYLASMVTAFDGFGSHQTRMVVVVNGLDSYKQDDVLKILEVVNTLFTQSPYIVIFAVDDKIIRKAVDKNRNDTWQISGRDYLQNMIHLPFYMHQQSHDLTVRRRKIMPQDNVSLIDISRETVKIDERTISVGGSTKSIHMTFDSRDSLFSPQDESMVRRRGGRRGTIDEKEYFPSTRKSRHEKAKTTESEMILDEDWLSSISPQLMRRILNSKSLTGRLLRANFVPVSSDRLSRWIKLTELAPYRTSWIIWHIEENEDIDLSTTLKSVYNLVLPSIPTNTQQDKVLAIDTVDSRDMEVLLSSRDPKDLLIVKDVVMFLPNTVNLDPNLREWIDDVYHSRLNKEKMPSGAPGASSLLKPLSRLSETTEAPVVSPMSTMTIPIISLPGSTELESLSCDELASWVMAIDNLTSSGQSRLSEYFLDQNITGAFLMKMRSKLDMIRTEAGLNHGDFFLLEEAIKNGVTSFTPSIPHPSPRSERREPIGETSEKGSKNVNFHV